MILGYSFLVGLTVNGLCVQHSKAVIYADDKVILCPGKNTTVIQQKLQNDMLSIQQWLTVNKEMYYHNIIKPRRLEQRSKTKSAGRQMVDLLVYSQL
jgi:hypothetical protein